MKSIGTKGQYQRCMPITSKNIGKNYIKGTRHEDSGSSEKARHHKQMQKIAELGSRRERQDCKRLGITLDELRKSRQGKPSEVS